MAAGTRDETSAPKSEEMTIPDIKTLRDAIPEHAFQPNTFLSVSTIVRDLAVSLALAVLAARWIPLIETTTLRYGVWIAYGFLQGCVFTGIWILAHECGHGALFSSSAVNNVSGFVLHSLLLVPYFSWKYTHARHHRYTNNMDKDTAFVPQREDDFCIQARLAELLELTEDSPVLNFVLLVTHQLIGWPVYMFFAVTSGPGSGGRTSAHQSHYDPFTKFFTSAQRPYVLLSDLGLLTVSLGLWQLAQHAGWSTVALLYGVPWLWVNHWIVAITFLHHTHHDALHYEDNAWTFQKGAVGTVDRDFGFIGRYLFHGIIEYHVIHHLFPRIPFYHAEEATEHIRPLLGKHYLRQPTSFVHDLYQTFVHFKHVEPTIGQTGAFSWRID